VADVLRSPPEGWTLTLTRLTALTSVVLLGAAKKVQIRKLKWVKYSFIHRPIFRSHFIVGWLGGVTGRASDLRSSGRGFDSRSGRCQATYRSTQPSILPGYVNRVPAWLAGVTAGRVHLCRVAGNTV